MYIDRSYLSTTPGLYGLPTTGQPNAACMHAFGAPSSTCESRWTLGTVADVEAMEVHLLPATAAGLIPVIVPALINVGNLSALLDFFGSTRCLGGAIPTNW